MLVSRDPPSHNSCQPRLLHTGEDFHLVTFNPTGLHSCEGLYFQGLLPGTLLRWAHFSSEDQVLTVLLNDPAGEGAVVDALLGSLEDKEDKEDQSFQAWDEADYAQVGSFGRCIS